MSDSVQPRFDTSALARMLTPACGLALISLCVSLWLFDRGAYFGVMAAFGVPALAKPFDDWEAVVQLMHCADRGVNVYAANQCGVFSYSPLWFWARLIPLGPTWQNIVGVSIDVAFVSSLWIVFRPNSWREAILFTLVCISPAVLYGAERANVDLIIFLILASALSLLGVRIWGFTAYILIGAAGLLKFFPFAGLFVAVRETTRRLIAIAFIAFVAAAAILLAMQSHLADLSANLPSRHFDFGAFGAQNLFYFLLGPASPPTVSIFALAGAGFGALATAVLAANDTGLAKAIGRMGDRDRDTLLLGSSIMVGCFLLVDNVMYRAVFLIFVVSGLIPLRRVADVKTRTQIAWLIFAIVAVMWSDPLWWVLYPNSTLIGPALSLILILVREIVWWLLILSLLEILMISASQSRSLKLLIRRLDIRLCGSISRTIK